MTDNPARSETTDLLTIVGRQSELLDLVQHRLGAIEGKLERIERLSHGASAVRMAGDRVLTRSLVGGLTMIYFVEADDLLLAPHFIMHGVYEPALSNYFLRNVRPTDHCVDVGANFGYFTCLFAKLAFHGRVLGVEADPKIAVLARDNVFANWCEGVAKVLNVAVSDGPGEVTLYRRIGRSGNTGIIKIDVSQQLATGEVPPEPFRIATASIDELIRDHQGHVDHMKIDVEGAEPLAFRGARETIARNAGLRIVMEWSPDQMQAAGFSIGDFTAELAALGLRASIIDDAGGLQPIGYPDLLQRGFLTGIQLAQAVD